MAEQKVPALPTGRWIGSDGTPSSQFRTLIDSIRKRVGGFSDKVDQAAVTADAAAPGTTEVVAGSGLQVGGQISGNVPVALYKVVTSVAGLPATDNAAGDWAYATNGRNSGEGAAAGTGTPVVWNAPLARWTIPGQTAAITA